MSSGLPHALKRALAPVVLGSTLAASSACVGPSTRTHVSGPPTPHGLATSGHGEARGEPDLARVNLGVEARAASASVAAETVNRQLSQILTAIQSRGVAREDVRTQDFSINFEQQPEPVPPPPEPRPRSAPAEEPPPSVRGHYRASNTVQVTVRDISKVGELLGAAVEAGANYIYGVQFEIGNPAPLESAAREQAIRSAQSRAAELARLAGVKLGRVISIQEGASMPMARGDGFAYSFDAARANAAIAPGQLTVVRDVQMVFEIEPQ